MTKKRDHDSTDANAGGSVGPLLAVAQVAELLNVQPRHIYRLVSERRIPYLKLGKLLRFELTAIVQWIHTNRHNPMP